MNDAHSVASAAIPVRVVPVGHAGSDPATLIPEDRTGPLASAGEPYDVTDLSINEPGPRDLDGVLASLRGDDSVQAFSEVAEPGPGVDAFDGAAGDGD
jgi:hypothetical protein